MKRFYCTICKRVKRVRKYPANVAMVNSEDVMQRVGTCTRHTPYSQFKRNTDTTVKVGQ